MWAINLRILVVALGVVGFYTLVAHLIPQLESEVPEALALGSDVTPEALVAAGERVYNGAGGCTACHGLGTRAPNLLADERGTGLIGARCGARKPGMDCKAYLHESMIAPTAFVVPGYEPIMPDMRRQLAEDQIWAVVAYLQSQGGEVTVTGADVASATTGDERPQARAAGPAPAATTDPSVLYREMGCVGCHQLDGAGGTVGPSFDGIGRRLGADAIRRSILEPNADTAKGYEKVAGTMPPNLGQQLSAAQLEALVRFLSGRR
jgi:mono/diheme cytochrome c family protein